MEEGKLKECFCTGPGHCPWHDTIVNRDAFVNCRTGKPPESTGNPCIYLGEASGEIGPKNPAYLCRRFRERCTLTPNQAGSPACSECKEKLRFGDRKFSQKWRDPLIVADRHMQPTDVLRDMLQGGAAFLVAGGPSLNSMPYHRLAERGIFSLAVNNVAGYAPVSAFTCSDPPEKFHWGIFCDPKIMKFIPVPKLKKRRGKIRKKKPNGEFVELGKSACDCPNVWGYERRTWLTMDDTWFTEPRASWGNLNEGVERIGDRKTACTLLLGIRLLQYLGARKIFLLGVDFSMRSDVGKHDNYAFGEVRLEGAVRSNNNIYFNAGRWLTGLRPVFDRWGFEVYNCNEYSALRAFDYVPFDDALEVCRGDVPADKFDLTDWYKKDEQKT